MVWLDRQGRMPTALPWFHLLVVTPVLAFLLLMISFQPNSYCNTILQHSEFRAFYVLFLPFLPLLAHMVGSNKVGRPWLFGCILTLSLLFVFDLTVAYEVLHMVYQNQAGEGVVYSGARAWECNHFRRRIHAGGLPCQMACQPGLPRPDAVGVDWRTLRPAATPW